MRYQLQKPTNITSPKDYSQSLDPADFLQAADGPVANKRDVTLAREFDVNYQIPLGKINYTNLTKDTRPYTAVVSLSGEKGTFKDLQAAITYVHNLGGGIVFIKNGQYILNQDITLFDDITIKGETTGGVILDFNNQSYQFIAQGNLVYNTGTIAANNNSNVVNGTNTTFTSSMVGSYILLQGLYYLITGYSSPTSLVLANTYSGDSFTGYTTVIADPIHNIVIDSVTIQNSTDTNGAMYFLYASGITLQNYYVYNVTLGLYYVASDLLYNFNFTVDSSTAGMTFDNCSQLSFDTFNLFNINTNDALSFTDCNVCSIFNFGVYSTTGRGLYMLRCYNVGILDFAILSTTGIGIELSSSYDMQFVSGNIQNGSTDGIKLTASNLRNSLTNLMVRSNGGYGINVAAASDTNNLILGNIFTTNTSGQVNDSGTTTKIRSNIGQADN